MPKHTEWTRTRARVQDVIAAVGPLNPRYRDDLAADLEQITRGEHDDGHDDARGCAR